jgi:hypothetical protein
MTKMCGFKPGQARIKNQSPQGRVVPKSHPIETVAGVSQILNYVRMAEWLRPGLWEILTIKLRGIEHDQVLIKKKPTGESGAKVMSSCNCGRRKPSFRVSR